MNNLAICIPTFKRPSKLKELLLSILNCNINPSMINDIVIHVLDNDPEKGAEHIVVGLSNKFMQPFRVYYYHYPVKGLANVRNELLKKALGQNTQFIIFVDDDEYVDKQWINELVKAVVNNNTDLAMGPVIPVFEKKVSKNISWWFDRPQHEPNSNVQFIRTGNLIIKVDSLLKYNVWFDERFNFTGGEDAFFGLQIRKKGAVIVWAANAIVYENIPEERTRLSWLMKRRYRGAANFVYEIKIEKRYLKLILKFLISLTYTFIGIIALLLVLIPIKKKYWGIFKVSEGMGGIAGFLNFRPSAY